MRPTAFALGLLLLASTGVAAFQQNDVAGGSLPPISRDYKAKITTWSRAYYADPRAVQSALISDPVLIRDRAGRLVWLVCLEAVNTSVSPNPERYAFGFAPDYFSSPLGRHGAILIRSDCDERALAWRPFREFGRI